LDNLVICTSDTLLVGNNEVQYGTQIRISPNPNSGLFSVELPEPARPEMRFRILDLTGRLVQAQKAAPGITQQTIQAGELPAGLYFLQVVYEGKLLATQKFVKQ
jgi:hypothetical protein